MGIEYMRGTAQVGRFRETTREAILRWYGHARRKDDGYRVHERDSTGGTV